MALSRRELCRDWVSTALGEISVSNGYRTNPLIHRHFVYPSGGAGDTHICVVVESEMITAQDDNMTDFDSEIKIVVLGRFNSTTSFTGTEVVSGGETDGEYLLHDIKQIVYTLMLEKVNTEGNRWLILGKKGVATFGPTYFPNNQGELRVEFYVKIYAEDREF